MGPDLAITVGPNGVVIPIHDTLEDTTATPEELEAQFGPEIRRLVEAVTRRAGEPFHAPTDPAALRLKAADALDNVTVTVEGLR
ncbi:MAG: hypothetical protein M3Q66_04395, partial [Chloroflexota bacterium]|nr:hypothetical protein [Chloroflexota bacterium]